MDWHQYENEITAYFKESYPSARITPDTILPGRFSKVDRQIDLLIEEQASDFSFRIVIDAKHRGRKLDVTDVEAFLGLIDDVGAHTGMMISLEGYSPAAYDRAYYDDLDIVLDILNFEELKNVQGLTGIPYSGDNGACLGAPLGWIVDGTKRPQMLATLYQRGLTFDEASKDGEWMYVNFCRKNSSLPDLDAVIKYQETYLRTSRGAKIKYEDGVRNQITGARTLIRRYEPDASPIVEFTGFVDFPKFVLLCVLFTPEHSAPANLRKLRFVMRVAFPMEIVHSKEKDSEEPPPPA